MLKSNHKYLLSAAGLFVLASVIGLCSWNTLAELFSLPKAQYKHVLAALFLSLMLRWVFSSDHHGIRHLFGRKHEGQIH